MTEMGATEGEIRGWVLGRLPEGWFTGPAEIQTDDDEILVVGTLDDSDLAAETGEARRAAEAARVQQFREETREQRMRIAQEGQRRYGRRLAWGARIGDQHILFTTLSIPVMTRLRLPERQVLDTLVQSGVARSRSDALAWCVRLVGRHESEWIRELREALVRVNELRRRGPA
jgi:hypothetical protein